MKSSLAPGIRIITSFSRDSWYRSFILFLTFLFYTAYHLSRKPISIVKSELHRNCSTVIRPADLNITNNDTWCDWAPFDQDNYQTLFGVVDNCFLVAYAIGMFFSGIFGERLPLRYYLSFGMLMSGLFTCLFGLGFYLQIHSLGYYAFIQVMNGLMQTTGWPAVVACVGNWFGKGKRGFIMGVWNSHTSVGNILGSLIAGAFVSTAWGMSFIVPGLIIASTGVLCFFFLVEKPEDVNCSPPLHHSDPEAQINTLYGFGAGDALFLRLKAVCLFFLSRRRRRSFWIMKECGTIQRGSDEKHGIKKVWEDCEETLKRPAALLQHAAFTNRSGI